MSMIIFAAAIFNSRTGKTEIFKVRPTIGALLKYLKSCKKKVKSFEYVMKQRI